MLSPLSKYAGFYQELLSGTVNYLQLAGRLIQLGEQAHLVRQFDKVTEVGLLLSNIPIKHYQAIGYYFLAVASSCGGNGDQDKAERLFQLAVDTAPDSYKAKALVSLGTLAIRKNDLDSASRYFQETIRAERLGPMSLQAMRGMSILKSIEGFHQSAITDVEGILPLIDAVPSRVRLDCLNSYAVELSEVGRLQEAESVSLIVTASPLARYDPRWQETLSEVRSKRKRRSTVTISRPQIEHEVEAESEVPENALQAARVQTVIDFMNANIKQKITLTEMAALTNLSPNHFCRVFKSETGLAPVQYLTKLRAEKARHLLITTFLSIKEIMAMTGYDVNGRSHFIHQFKRYFDLAPSQYRKRFFTRKPR